MRNLVLPVTAAAVIAVIAVAVWLALTPKSQHLSPAMLNAQGADIGGPFELTAHTGERMTSAQVIDRPTLIYFGYTFCPDICPVDTQIMVDTVDILEKSGTDVRPVFITVDPARDTPKELAYYAEALHPKMLALTGTEAEIRAAADAYKVFYNKVELGGSAAEYLMEHTGFTYLMTPEQGLVAVFRRDFSPEQIASDIQKVLAAL